MASVYIQNKRGRVEEFWNGGFGLPEAKRMNMGHDTDLMALLDRIDSFDYVEKNAINETGIVINELEEEERLNGVIKSLEDEIGFKPNEENVACNEKNVAYGDKIFACEDKNVVFGDKIVACMDNVANVACGDDEKKEVEDDNNTGSLAEEISMAAQGNLYYDGEFGFFMDHAAPATAADEIAIIMSHCQSADHSMSNFYLDSLHGYSDNTEVFYGSLWEDDIWQVNDHGGFFQNDDFSSSTTQQEVQISGAESQDVGNDLRPTQ